MCQQFKILLTLPLYVHLTSSRSCPDLLDSFKCPLNFFSLPFSFISFYDNLCFCYFDMIYSDGKIAYIFSPPQNIRPLYLDLEMLYISVKQNQQIPTNKKIAQ